MVDRPIDVSHWLVGAVGVVIVAVILSLIDADVALWEDEHEPTDRPTP